MSRLLTNPALYGRWGRHAILAKVNTLMQVTVAHSGMTAAESITLNIQFQEPKDILMQESVCTTRETTEYRVDAKKNGAIRK